MKIKLGLIAGLLGTTLAYGQLAFTWGTVTNGTNVALYLHGPTNQTCLIERLTPGPTPTNLTWTALGTVQLDNYGFGQYTANLWNGCYGVYRTRTTNGIYYSTNAFGIVRGELAGGWSMVGNPFDARAISEILPEPAEFTTVYRWNRARTVYESVSYCFGEWDGQLTIGAQEGFMVCAPTNVSQPFVVGGLFSTNPISNTLSNGYNMLCTPLLETDYYSWLVDSLTTNQLGGKSLLPVTTPGTNTQCTIIRMMDNQGTYGTYTLGTNNVWMKNGYATSVPLHLAEGFWFNKPTNAAWSVSRKIW